VPSIEELEELNKQIKEIKLKKKQEVRPVNFPKSGKGTSSER